MELFDYENYNLSINKPDVLMIKEFETLFVRDKSKTKDKVLAECKYIYLFSDWKTPYFNYSEKEKHEAALLDSGLKEFEIDEPIKEAIKKYKSLQETHFTKLLKSAYKAVDELRLYYETCDLQERDVMTNKPVTNHKDVVASIQNLGKLVDGLKVLEHRVKTEQEATKALKGSVEKGMFD